MRLLLIEKAGGLKVKIVFKKYDTRLPIIGKFVYLEDSDSLKSKGMIRFVPASKFDFWSDSNPQVALTKIFVVNDIEHIFSVD